MTMEYYEYIIKITNDFTKKFEYDIDKPISCLDFHATGSREICIPAPTDTDEDYCIFVGKMEPISGKFLEEEAEELFCEFLDVLEEEEFKCTNEEYDANGREFFTFRKKNINLIVTPSRDFYHKHRLATLLSKKLNLLDKKDRVSVFEAFLYDKVVK